ncbi:MAG: outer membrane beta-barrel protein [Betaproteobacteria bacterium]
MKRIIRTAVGFGSLIWIVAGSSAANAQYHGGLNLNAAQFGILQELTQDDPGFFIASTALDDRRIRYGLKLGYKVAPFLSIVSRYADFDRRDTLSKLSRSYGIELESRLPLTSRFSVTGSAGFARLRGEPDFNGGFYPDLVGNAGSRAYGASAGRFVLGMEYQWTNSLGLRFNVERYRALRGSSMGDLDADHVSFGVTVRF